ncbi:MAG: GFA family protein [Pseudomonadota bacterium]
MQDKTVHKGGCLCGAIRFEAKAPVLKPHTCSCKMCQRHSGAPTTWWVEIPKEAITWTGTGGIPATYRSSEISSRAFCPKCGSTLGSIDDAPFVALLLGVFDDAGGQEFIPVSHSHPEGRPDWLSIGTRDDYQ